MDSRWGSGARSLICFGGNAAPGKARLDGLWCPASTPTPLALIWISRLRSDCTKIGASRSFLGGNLLRTLLGNDYVERLFAAYAGRVPAEADLVIDWIFFTSSKAS